MKIIKYLDDKLMNVINKLSHNSDDLTFKSHSFVTTFAIAIPWNAISLFKDQSNETIPKILIISSIVFGVASSIGAFYEWRYFLNLRKIGKRKDKNLFFDESAGLYRKLAFYLALFIYFIFDLLKIGRWDNLQYLVKADFYRLLGLNIFKIIFIVIVLVELSRIFLPQTVKWSNKKHLFWVIFLSAIISALQTILLSFVSGHGII